MMPKTKIGNCFSLEKNNLARKCDGLAFTIVGNPPAIQWEPDPVAMTADDALAVEHGGGDPKPGPEPVSRNAAADWLRKLLADGPVEVKRIRDDSVAAGFAWRTVERAASDEPLLERMPPAMGMGWHWRLADPTDNPPSVPPNLLKGNNLASWREPIEPTVSDPPNALPAKLFYLGERAAGHAPDASMRTPNDGQNWGEA